MMKVSLARIKTFSTGHKVTLQLKVLSLYLLTRTVYILRVNCILAVKITPVNMREKDFVSNGWFAKLLDVFVYVSTHDIDTVKNPDFILYEQLSRWSRGNAPDCRARFFDVQV